MDLDKLLGRPCGWLRGNGADSDVVISSRARLTRNFAGFPFVNRATDSDLERVVDLFLGTAGRLFNEDEASTVDVALLTNEDARFLLERRLIGSQFVDSKRPRAALFATDESFSVAVDEEDHLRLRATAAGLALNEVWEKANALDDRFEAELDYAFDEKFGYLTSCPSNVGTGLRASVLLHLPGLIETGEIAKVLRSLQKLNLVARGFFGDESRITGELLLISNQTTLGVSEQAIVKQLLEVVDCVVDYERKARQTILERNRERLFDRCSRALGILRSARSTSFEEALVLISSLRLGVRLNLLEQTSIELVDALTLQVQPAHLRKIADEEGNFEEDEDVVRADFLRKKLASIKSS